MTIPRIRKHPNGFFYLTYQNHRHFHITERLSDLAACQLRLAQLQESGEIHRTEAIRVVLDTDMEMIKRSTTE